MKNSLDSWLLNEIRNELLSGSHGTGTKRNPAFFVARAIIEREPERTDAWKLEKIALISQREFVKLARPERSYQQFLPGMDFADMLPQRKGAVPLGEATVQQLREGVAAIRIAVKAQTEKRADRRVAHLKRLIIEMGPYARVHHGLTVAGYVELRAAGVAPGVKAHAGALRA